MDEILGTRAATRPPEVLESSLTEDATVQELGSSSDEGDGYDEVNSETTGLTSASTLTSHRNEEERETRGTISKRELEDKQEPLPKKGKKIREKKSSAMEKVLSGMMEKFNEYREKAEERLLKYEEQRREEREHEERMMMMALHLQSPPRVPPLRLFYSQSSSCTPEGQGTCSFSSFQQETPYDERSLLLMHNCFIVH